MNKGQGITLWTTGNEPQKTAAGMGKKATRVLLVGLALATIVQCLSDHVLLRGGKDHRITQNCEIIDWDRLIDSLN
jgi:hypothetical protein